MKNNRGGKRHGAGRPTLKGKTKSYSMRLEVEPTEKAMEKSGLKITTLVEKLIKDYIAA
jgi:hypothetical protein